VAWLYWPEELPPPKTITSDTVNSISGRRKYHGSHELIASNHLEVLDVLSFAGKADVYPWEEEDDNLTWKLFWRQILQRGPRVVCRSPSYIHVRAVSRSSENTASAMDIITPRWL
jgi:hypothetical protein